MALRYWLVCAVLGCSLSVSTAAEDAIPWQVNLESAKRLASQTNRLVLVHFWADWCQPCKTMERDVFSRPDVAAAIQADYVAVKLHADYFPHTARQYGVTALPADVILTPQGEAIERSAGASDPSRYVAMLRNVAATSKNLAGGAGPAPAAPRYGQEASHGALAASGSAAPQEPTGRYADYYRSRGGAPASPADRARPDAPPHDAVAQSAPVPESSRPAVQIPPGNPPLGLEGFCPVRLTETEQWVLGDPRWGLIHHGRTYLFAGPEERNRFDAQPDRYAPVLAGHDVVLAIEQSQMVPGRREIGAWFEGRVYLFSSEQSYRRFSAAPERYAAALQSQQDVARRPDRSGPSESLPNQRGASRPY